MAPKRTRMARQCRECGKTFEVVRSRAKRGADKFCSMECVHRSWERKAINRTCPQCGESFRTTPYKAKQGWGNRCSRKCHGLSRRHRVWLTCKTCGTKFEEIISRVNRNRGKYCSRACMNADTRRGWINNQGYMTMKHTGHPLASKGGVLYGHWASLWEHYGHPEWMIEAKNNGATIHHKNGQRADNRPENLEIRWQGNHGKGWTTDAMIEQLTKIGYHVEPEKLT